MRAGSQIAGRQASRKTRAWQNGRVPLGEARDDVGNEMRRSARTIALAVHLILVTWLACPGWAQPSSLLFATVDRAPFSMPGAEGADGFSIALMREIADVLGRDVAFVYMDSFPEMLGAVERGEVDGAIANISITGAREAVLDFSQPIFQSGLQIMMRSEEGSSALWRVLLSRDLLLTGLAAFALLFGGGMAMWLFERGRQPYFDRPLNEALFPSFWWALNLVVNGGFEERMPRSLPGRVFGVVLVVSSLFVVSVFVANITAKMTVQAITASVDNVSDLDGRRVGTTLGSSASAFLSAREVSHRRYASFDELIADFEAGGLDAVVFDGPLLSYYLSQPDAAEAELIDRVFRVENYGIALPTGSALREPINVALLGLRETGTYDALVSQWFGSR